MKNSSNRPHRGNIAPGGALPKSKPNRFRSVQVSRKRGKGFTRAK